MPLCCHSPNWESHLLSLDYHWACQPITTGLPIKCHSVNKNTSQANPHPMYIHSANLLQILCHSDYHGTTTLPIHRQSSTTWLPLCCHSVNTMSLRLPMINHSTNPLPIQCHLTTTFQPISRWTTNESTTKSVPLYFHSRQWTTTQVYLITNRNPLTQSIVNPVPLDHHSTNTATHLPLDCHLLDWTMTTIRLPFD